MAKVYADLIRKSLKTIEQVPERILEQVRKIITPEVPVLPEETLTEAEAN